MAIQFPGYTDVETERARIEALAKGTPLAQAGDAFADALLAITREDLLTPGQAALQQNENAPSTPAALLQVRAGFPNAFQHDPLTPRKLSVFLGRRLQECGIDPEVFDIPAGRDMRSQLFVSNGVVVGVSADNIRVALEAFCAQSGLLESHETLLFPDAKESSRSWESELFERLDSTRSSTIDLHEDRLSTARKFESTAPNAGIHMSQDKGVRALNFKYTIGLIVRAGTLGDLDLPSSVVSPIFGDYVKKSLHYGGC